MRGRFITVEGGEGAGKSTGMRAILAALRDAGVGDVLETREPGGTAIGERIRSVLLDPGSTALVADAELLLMFAARAQHLAEVIEPALAAGTWVVCDRFTDASFAYQGGGRGIPMARIAELERWLLGEWRPDLTLLLDVSAGTGLRRALSGRHADRFETEQRAFHDRVRRTYLDRARAEPGRFVVVDAEKSRSRVQGTIRDAVRRYVEACDA